MNLIQLLTDPENQPHQFVGMPDDLKEAMSQELMKECEDETMSD